MGFVVDFSIDEHRTPALNTGTRVASKAALGVAPGRLHLLCQQRDLAASGANEGNFAIGHEGLREGVGKRSYGHLSLSEGCRRKFR